MLRVIIHHTKNITHFTAKVIKYAGKKAVHIFCPPLTHYLTDKYQDRKHHLIVDTILAVAVVLLVTGNASLGYWYYLFLTPPEVAINISLPEQIISGEKLNFQFDYTVSRRPVEELQILIIYPDGYIADAKNNQHLYLGHQAAGSANQFKLKGKIFAAADSTENIRVIYGYVYQGKVYEQEYKKAFNVAASRLTISTELPQAVLKDAEFSLNIKYANGSELPRENVELLLDIPENLTINKCDAPYDVERKVLTLAEISPLASGQVICLAKFNTFGDVNNLIGVQVQEENFSQNSQLSLIEVLNPRLTLAGKINDAPSGNIDQGGNAVYTLTYENIGDAELKELEVSLDISAWKDFYSYINPKEGEKIEDKIIWKIPQVAPAAKGEVSVLIEAKTDLLIKDLEISTTATAKAKLANLAGETTAPDVKNSIKFNTDVNCVLQARYFGNSGEQLGYGPYPLKVNEITALRIFLEVDDFYNDLNNVTLVTTLPSQVTWTGETSVSVGTNLTYDEVTRTITWHVGSLAAFSTPQGASFEVRVLPNYLQQNQQINLTNEAKFTALDAFTGKYLEKTIPALQTEQVIGE